MKTEFKGRTWLLGDDIDTDIIIPTEYLALPTVAEMARFAFSPLRPELASQIQPGDIIVAGKNFGCGSSREQAPAILKELKIGCIIAQSFARIFFRNAVNNGLLLLENNVLCKKLKEGDEVEVMVGQQIKHAGTTYPLMPMDEKLLEILSCGGLVERMRQLNGVN